MHAYIHIQALNMISSSLSNSIDRRVYQISQSDNRPASDYSSSQPRPNRKKVTQVYFPNSSSSAFHLTNSRLPFILTNCHRSFGSLSVATLVDFFLLSLHISKQSYNSRRRYENDSPRPPLSQSAEIFKACATPPLLQLPLIATYPPSATNAAALRLT